MASVKYGHLTQGFLCERSRGFEVFEQINIFVNIKFTRLLQKILNKIFSILFPKSVNFRINFFFFFQVP
jgi:hypothetical protein